MRAWWSASPFVFHIWFICCFTFSFLNTFIITRGTEQFNVQTKMLKTVVKMISRFKAWQPPGWRVALFPYFLGADHTLMESPISSLSGSPWWASPVSPAQLALCTCTISKNSKSFIIETMNIILFITLSWRKLHYHSSFVGHLTIGDNSPLGISGYSNKLRTFP